MKKILSVIMILMLSTTVMTGCSSQQNQTPTQAPEQTQQNQTSTQVPGQTSQNHTQNAVDTSNFIGEEKAKEIALQRAGITPENVVFDKVELDYDDGIWEYEVEFRQDRNEYDVHIKAEDGTVISFETDYDD